MAELPGRFFFRERGRHRLIYIKEESSIGKLPDLTESVSCIITDPVNCYIEFRVGAI